jgi:phenylacetate-CoA ligase
MLHQLIFSAGCWAKYPGLIPLYHRLQKTQWLSREDLQARQEQYLAGMIDHCYKNVPYYRQLFDQAGLAPADIRTISDLQKIPVLDKHTLKSHPAEFKPKNLSWIRYLNRSTSGSTGIPLKFRVAREDWEYSQALILRDWGYAGFKPGDRRAGMSWQTPHAKHGLTKSLLNFALNLQSFYCMNVNREMAIRYFNALNRYQPQFLQGGPLPVSLFAQFLRDNHLKLQIKLQAVITNGEKLFAHQRKIIEEMLGAPVYNWYGLDDGGLSAIECSEHRGLHIDMERSILEVVDEAGRQVVNREGRILATSLHNYAQPFLRYETGDLGIISDRICRCARKTPLLEEITGRIEGYIVTTSDLKVHGSVFQAWMDQFDHISQFQVVQEKTDEVLVKVVPEKWESAAVPDIREIQKTLAAIDPNMKVRIELVSADRLEYTAAGKHKFVVNKLDRKVMNRDNPP